MLFLAFLLPLALRVLRRLWVKISIWKRFQPDFLTPIKTLLFKSFEDNVNYNAPGENYFVMLVVILTFSVCSAIAEGIHKRFPEAIDLPDNATGSYPGDVDAANRPPLQKGADDSQWVQWQIVTESSSV